jgi:hypothetical protein
LASSIESRFHKVSRDGGPIDFFRANVSENLCIYLHQA